jgi:hypothetical protein
MAVHSANTATQTETNAKPAHIHLRGANKGAAKEKNSASVTIIANNGVDGASGEFSTTPSRQNINNK